MSEEKSCENCCRYYNVRPSMRQGACQLDALDGHGCAPIHNADDEACDRWREIELPLGQRFQQLGQLARDMYRAIAPMHEHCCEETCASLGDMGWGDGFCCQGFREQLMELGVILDD